MTPSVFVIDKSPCGVSVSASVALLLPLFVSVNVPGAETVAVFDNVPVADEMTVPLTV